MMANSTGKKIANTGINKVPRPNPEKNVNPAATKAAIPIMKGSSQTIQLIARDGTPISASGIKIPTARLQD
jgi:hypothetical protein